FGVSGVIATRAQVGPDDRYTGELEFYAYGEQKAHAIRQLAARVGLDLSGSFAYSDSITDVPMLEAVGHPVAVNPDKELRTLAEERGWEARDFRSPVRLRSRLASAVPAPRPSVVAVAVGAAAVIAVLGWVVLRSRGSKRPPGRPV
ncbi:MAG: HAD family hydrolase, partial [Actinomycetota bacterium]